jgi:hypothetical protein
MEEDVDCGTFFGVSGNFWVPNRVMGQTVIITIIINFVNFVIIIIVRKEGRTTIKTQLSKMWTKIHQIPYSKKSGTHISIDF